MQEARRRMMHRLAPQPASDLNSVSATSTA